MQEITKREKEQKNMNREEENVVKRGEIWIKKNRYKEERQKGENKRKGNKVQKPK